MDDKNLNPIDTDFKEIPEEPKQAEQAEKLEYGKPDKNEVAVRENAQEKKGYREYFEDKYEGRETDKYDSYDFMQDAKKVDVREEPSVAARVLLILMAIFLHVIGAVAGIVVGIVYMNKEQLGYKSYGKVLLIISIVFLVLDILGIIAIASVVGELFHGFMHYGGFWY